MPDQGSTAAAGWHRGAAHSGVNKDCVYSPPVGHGGCLLLPHSRGASNTTPRDRWCSEADTGYLFGYTQCMRSDGDVLLRARLAAGLSQVALAAKAGTSRTSLSAYEHGRKSPTLATAARIARAAGFDLTISPRITFRDVAVGRGRSIPVPDALPRLAPDQAFATVQLAIHLNWSDRDRRFDLHDRRQRARVYEIVLREGAAEDVLAHIDGALLVDLWDELVLPREVRIAWDDVVRGPLPDRVAS